MLIMKRTVCPCIPHDCKKKDRSHKKKCRLFECGCGWMGLGFGPGCGYDLDLHLPDLGFPCGLFGCNPCNLFGCPGTTPADRQGILGEDGYCLTDDGCEPCPPEICSGPACKVCPLTPPIYGNRMIVSIYTNGYRYRAVVAQSLDLRHPLHHLRRLRHQHQVLRQYLNQQELNRLRLLNDPRAARRSTKSGSRNGSCIALRTLRFHHSRPAYGKHRQPSYPLFVLQSSRLHSKYVLGQLWVILPRRRPPRQVH